MKKIIWWFVSTLCPKNPFFDSLLAYIRFFLAHKRLPNRRDPKSFNDLLFDTKLSKKLRSPIYTFTTDKELVKQYIKDTVGDQFNVPTQGIYKSQQAFMVANLAYPCVIKPTHLSGEIIFASEKSDIDFKITQGWFDKNHYTSRREVNYKWLIPKIIVEPVLFGNVNVKDYKFFCYNGRPVFYQVDYDRATNHTRMLFDVDGNPLNCSVGYPVCTEKLDELNNEILSKMIELAEKLSRNFGFVRVDFYTEDSEIFVGEITHVHGSANERFFPIEAEKVISALLSAKGKINV